MDDPIHQQVVGPKVGGLVGVVDHHQEVVEEEDHQEVAVAEHLQEVVVEEVVHHLG